MVRLDLYPVVNPDEFIWRRPIVTGNIHIGPTAETIRAPFLKSLRAVENGNKSNKRIKAKHQRTLAVN